jgi:hypothetical protein
MKHYLITWGDKEPGQEIEVDGENKSVAPNLAAARGGARDLVD